LKKKSAKPTRIQARRREAWFIVRNSMLLVTADFYRGDLWTRVSAVAEAIVRGIGRDDYADWLARLATDYSKRALQGT